MREIDGEDAMPFVADVSGFTITYYDDPTTWDPFVPASEEQLVKIRVVEVEIVVDPRNARLIDAEMPSVVLRTRVTPRSLGVS
jgi:hypothetical protein